MKNTQSIKLAYRICNIASTLLAGLFGMHLYTFSKYSIGCAFKLSQKCSELISQLPTFNLKGDIVITAFAPFAFYGMIALMVMTCYFLLQLKRQSK